VKALLDTHALLWWLFDDPQLSDTARSVIAAARNHIFVSSASAWRMGASAPTVRSARISASRPRRPGVW